MMTLQSETQHIKNKHQHIVLGLSQSDIDIRYRFNIMDYIRLHLKSIFCHSASALLKSVVNLLLLTVISFCVQ